MSYKHASIVPLIGGETIAQMSVFKSFPECIVSYSPFQANESHFLNYLKEKTGSNPLYYLLDQNQKPHQKVDVVNAVCPCAGLSFFSMGYGDDNQNNQWMIKTAEFVLGEWRPKVFWGENAPAFAGKVGTNIRNQLRKIGAENGYTMTVYRTKSLLHGLPQVRERSFYFFWKDEKTPLLNYYRREHTRIEDLITSVKSNFQMEPINPKTPSRDDPYYRYLLEDVHGGINHRQFFDLIVTESVRDADMLSRIQMAGKSYLEVAEWMRNNGYEKDYEKCLRRHKKLEEGGNIMRRTSIVPKDYIGAFVGHYPFCLTHPYEDRYITYREAMTIMGLPQDYELLNPKKSVNHICQNVPVTTARDMATEVKAYLDGELEMVDSKYVFQSNHTQSHEIMDREERSLESFFS